jgi:uncharacterized membrane protein YcaP (DUF421 family)
LPAYPNLVSLITLAALNPARSPHLWRHDTIDAILAPGIPIASLVVRSIAIYVVFLVALRVFGKRELGQFTPFDLVLMLLVANALQPAMTGPDNSVTGGIVIVVTLFLFDRFVGRALFGSARLRHALVGKPVPIAENGRWIEYALRREGIDSDERDEIIRKHGYEDVSQIRLALLETDGSVSVFPLLPAAAADR